VLATRPRISKNCGSIFQQEHPVSITETTHMFIYQVQVVEFQQTQPIQVVEFQQAQPINTS